MSVPTARPPALDREFRSLAAEWRAASRFAAAPSAAADHPAYRAMVGLGKAVVPLALAALAADTDPAWFAALRELTGADPVPAADRGQTEAAAGHWLAWGRVRGLV